MRYSSRRCGLLPFAGGTGTVQSRVRLIDGLVKGLTVRGSNAEFQRSGLARTIAAREGLFTLGAAAVNLFKIGELRKDSLVAQRHIYGAVVREG